MQTGDKLQTRCMIEHGWSTFKRLFEGSIFFNLSQVRFWTRRYTIIMIVSRGGLTVCLQKFVHHSFIDFNGGLKFIH